MQIIEVNTPRLKKQFIDFPHDLYEGDPNYVPELYIAQKELMDERKNPFFKHARVALFLALRDGKIVGRIAAIRNGNYIKFSGQNVGFFGFFDVIEDYEVARKLLDTAADRLRKEGLTAILGPANFSTNDTAGLLVEGFDSPPVVMMTYNKPYYKDFLEKYGFTKTMDMFAYFGHKDNANLRTVKLAKRIEERLAGRGIKIRPVNMKNFWEDVKKIEKVYIKAWDKNWGFVPPTSEEFHHLAEGLKMIIEPDLALIAEKDGEAVGFIAAIPDLNIILRNVRRGRLLPFGIFKLLWGLFVQKKIHRLRIILLGVLEDYRRRGIEGVLIGKVIANGLKKGYVEAEASWILENNEMMRKGVEDVNMVPYKRYRMYEKPL
ncbi:MAG: GNAT family N-acetyltransferase [Bacteroidetes bacterium]|nr:MAG: GNAT family N-acetyltransferase [Bacteroidota bacterium]